MLGAAGAVAAFGAVSIKAASDLGESLNKARVVFGQASSEVISFSEKTASSLGIAQSASLEAAAGFGAMAQSAGLSERASADMSIKLVELSADMASFNNQDPSEMLERMRAGLAGEAEPLRKFGVFISEARVQTEAYASGIAKVGDELTDAQKIQARYAIILEDTQKASGDFARTLGSSLPNQIRVAKAEFTDLAAAVGKSLLPAVLEITQMVRELVQLMEPALKGAFDLVAEGARDLTGQLKEMISPFQEFIAMLPGLKTESDSAGFSLLGVFKAAQTLANVPQQFIHPIGRWQEAWRELTGATEETGSAFIDLGPTFETTGGIIAETLQSTGQEIIEAGQRAQNFAKLTDKEFKELADNLRAEIPGIVGTVTTVKDTFTLSPNDLKKIADSWAEIAKTIARDFKILARSDLEPAVKAAIAGLPPEMRHAWVEGNEAQRAAIEASVRKTLNFERVYSQAIREAKGGGEDVGRALGEGIKVGIRSLVTGVAQEAGNMVAEAISAARERAKATSPSKLMINLGQDMAEGLIIGLRSRQKELEELAGRIEAHIDRLKSRADALKSAVSGGFSQFLGLGGALDVEEGQPVDIAGFVQQQLASARQFAHVLEALRRQGAGPSLLSEIAGMGEGALQFAQELLQLGPEQIARLDKQYEAIRELQRDTAKGLSEKFFGQKIDNLQTQLKFWGEELRHIGLLLERALERREKGLEGLGLGGDVILTIDGATFARVTRDQLNKLANRNAGTGLN